LNWLYQIQKKILARSVIGKLLTMIVKPGTMQQKVSSIFM